MTTTTHPDQGKVFVVITRDPDNGMEVSDVEVLDRFPMWNLTKKYQILRIAYINGGDSIYFPPCDVRGCRELSTEFFEFNSEDGANVCGDHYDDLFQHLDGYDYEIPDNYWKD